MRNIIYGSFHINDCGNKNRTSKVKMVCFYVILLNINLYFMEEGKRQKQIAGLLQQELNKVFQRLGLNMIDGGLISIASIKVTPDLLEARIYLSLYKVQYTTNALKYIEEQAWAVKKELAARVKHQLRRIPVLKFYIDDTLDNVFKMEELFKKINSSKKEE